MVDSDSYIINIVAKWHGSVHDSIVLNESSMSEYFENINRQAKVLLLGIQVMGVKAGYLLPIANTRNPQQERFNRFDFFKFWLYFF